MHNIRNLGLTLSSIALLAACATQPTSSKPEDLAEAIQVPYSDVGCQPMPLPVQEIDELDLPNGPLANKSVFFDFDKYVVRDADKPVAQNHAAYLNKNSRRILIQGHTDERGGSEYNLALGQKRAEAVRKAMAVLGVAEDRMEAVSLGKEKPKDEGHNEAAWAMNRRVDIVYKGQ